MSSNQAVIDLTGDDDVPSERRRARVSHGSQANSQTDKKPVNGGLNMNRGRPAPSSSTQRLSSTAVDITSAPSRNSDPRKSLNGNSQAAVRAETPRSQNGGSAKIATNGSTLRSNKDQRSQRRGTEIDLTEDDERDLSDRPPPKQFKMPCGYDPTGFTPPSSQTSNAFSPRKANGELSRKRPLESQSPRESPPNRASPFKRQKLDRQKNGDRLDSNSQSESQSGAKIRREASTRPIRSLSPENVTPKNRQDLSRPSTQTKSVRTSQDVRSDTTPTKVSKSGLLPSVTSANGNQISSASPAKRKDGSKSSSQLENTASVISSTQSKQQREAPSKGSRAHSSLGSMPFREQRSPNSVDTTTAAGTRNSGFTSRGDAREDSYGVSQQREASVVTGSNVDSNGRSKTIERSRRGNESLRNGMESTSKGRIQSPASQNRSPILTDTNESRSSTNGGSLRRAAPYAMNANSNTAASWKTSLRAGDDTNSGLAEKSKTSVEKSRVEPNSASTRNSTSNSVPPSASPQESKSPKKGYPDVDRSVHSDDFANSKATVRASGKSDAPRDVATAMDSHAPSSNAVTNPLVAEILGDLQFAPAAISVIESRTNIKRVELIHLKNILESHPATRTDAAALQEILFKDNRATDESGRFTGKHQYTNIGEPSRNTFTEAEEADRQLQSEAMQDVVQQDKRKEASKIFVPPTVSASALKASLMFSMLPLASRVEKILGRYLEELRGDAEYWTSVSMRRARLSKEEDSPQDLGESNTTHSERSSSFAHMKPLNFALHKKSSSSTKSDEEVWQIQRMTTESKPQTHVDRSASFVTFATETPDVPDYAHYVSIKHNILAPNIVHLHAWPYFGDDFDISKAGNLQGQYNIDIHDRERKLLLLLQAQKYEEYVGSALQDLDCSWADVLRFLLEPNPDVVSDLDARKAHQNRPQYCEQDFSRTSERWITVLSSLPPSTPEKLGRVAVLCEIFQKMAKFSLWHVAKRSDLAKLPESSKTDPPQPSDNELTCRICLRFNCPYHGQFKHHAEDSGSDSDNDSVSSVDSVVAKDIVHPPKANYRSRIAFLADPPTALESNSDVLFKKRQKDPTYWNNYKNKAEDRGPFYPCNHPGTSCEDAKCRCFERNIPCEKSCGCSPACPRKFKGCSCGLRKGHRLVCFEDADCACYQLGRECDPDLCGTCGVCDVIDPVNKYNDSILTGRCRNACIQRGVPKHTLLGDSGVHGLGLYACEPIKQNDFVGEYKGEIITKREADRRGAVYEYQKLSYLFSLNKAQEIDSTYFGNKVRFINHAHGDKANLYPRIIMVNTVHRIALYAGKDIVAGKELLFDYGPYFPDDQLQGKKSKKSTQPESKKSAPHVRNANLVREFFDVEESEDEDGILRTKAVSHRAAGTKGRANGRKPRGGARPNAGRKPVPAKSSSSRGPQKPSSELGPGPNAEERLAAFNISDDLSSWAVETDPNGVEEDDEAFEPEGSESDDDSEESAVSERSDSDDDDEEDEEIDRVRTSRRRGPIGTRNRG